MAEKDLLYYNADTQRYESPYAKGSEILQLAQTVSDLTQTTNEKVEEVSTQLARNDKKTPINSYDEGVLGNRAIDESDLLQAAIHKAEVNGLKKLIIPEATYRLEKPVYVSNSLEIEMQNATFEWHGQGTISGNANNSLIGMFNFHGKIRGGESIVPYLNGVADGTHNPPTQARQLLSFTQDYMSSRFHTSDNSQFNVGDWVLIMAWTRPEGFPYDTNKIEPELRKMVKVIRKDDNYIYTDYQSPITYPTPVYNEHFKSVVIPIEPVEDVKITGKCKIVDGIESPADSEGNPSNGQSDDAPVGISCLLVKNSYIDNVEIEKHRFNAIHMSYCHDIKITNVQARHAQWWSGGKGYAIQVNGCRIGEIKNVLADECRHTVDFSWSSEMSVYQARSVNAKGFDFTMHGYGEHDIIWYNSTGSVCINHYYELIPEIVQNITFNNCDLRFAANGYTGYADNIVFDNCRINTSELSLYNIVKFKDCDITLRPKSAYDKSNNRNSAKETSIDMVGCLIKPQYTAGQLTYGIVGYDNVNMYNISIKPVYTLENLNSAISLIIKDSKKINIDSSNIKYIGVTVEQEKHNVSTVNISNTLFMFKTKNGVSGLSFVNSNGKTFFTGMLNNTVLFDALNDGDSIPIYTVSGVSFVDSYLYLNMADNKLIGNKAESINSALGTGVNSTVLLTDYKNVIKFKKTSAIYNVDDNIFI